MSTAGFKVDDVGALVRAGFILGHVAGNDAMFSVVTRGATAAIKEGATRFKAMGRQRIVASGLSQRWANAWRVQTYPSGGRVSLKSSIYAYHNIPYSDIFESGGTIRPKNGGMLWLPLKSTPRKGPGKPTPKKYAAGGVKMFSINRPGKRPLLATKVRIAGLNTSADRAKGRRTTEGKLVTFARLKKGVSGKRGDVVTVPLFFGLESVTIRGRLRLGQLADDIRNMLPEIYMSVVQGE